MPKLYCHLCKEGGKECIEVTDQRELALLKFHIKCAVCGKPLAK